MSAYENDPRVYRSEDTHFIIAADSVPMRPAQDDLHWELVQVGRDDIWVVKAPQDGWKVYRAQGGSYEELTWGVYHSEDCAIAAVIGNPQ